MREIRHDADAIPEFFERLKDFGEFERLCLPPSGVHLSMVAPCGT